MEELAESDSGLRPGFIELLESRNSWSPVSEEGAGETVLTRFHEMDGRNAEGSDIYQRRFFKRKTSGAPQELEEAG